MPDNHDAEVDCINIYLSWKTNIFWTCVILGFLSKIIYLLVKKWKLFLKKLIQANRKICLTSSFSKNKKEKKKKKKTIHSVNRIVFLTNVYVINIQNEKYVQYNNKRQNWRKHYTSNHQAININASKKEDERSAFQLITSNY